MNNAVNNMSMGASSATNGAQPNTLAELRPAKINFSKTLWLSWWTQVWLLLFPLVLIVVGNGSNFTGAFAWVYCFLFPLFMFYIGGWGSPTVETLLNLDRATIWRMFWARQGIIALAVIAATGIGVLLAVISGDVDHRHFFGANSQFALAAYVLALLASFATMKLGETYRRQGLMVNGFTFAQWWQIRKEQRDYADGAAPAAAASVGGATTGAAGVAGKSASETAVTSAQDIRPKKPLQLLWNAQFIILGTVLLLAILARIGQWLFANHSATDTSWGSGDITYLVVIYLAIWVPALMMPLSAWLGFGGRRATYLRVAMLGSLLLPLPVFLVDLVRARLLGVAGLDVMLYIDMILVAGVACSLIVMVGICLESAWLFVGIFVAMVGGSALYVALAVPVASGAGIPVLYALVVAGVAAVLWLVCFMWAGPYLIRRLPVNPHNLQYYLKSRQAAQAS